MTLELPEDVIQIARELAVRTQRGLRRRIGGLDRARCDRVACRVIP